MIIEKIKSGVSECLLDTLIFGPKGEPLLTSFYERAVQTVRGVGAGIVVDNRLIFRNKTYRLEDEFETIYTPIIRGKERFTHGVAYCKSLREKYLITTEKNMLDDLYFFLMNRYNLPLLREWMPKMSTALQRRGYLARSVKRNVVGHDHEISYMGKSMRFSQLWIFSVDLNDEQLRNLVSTLLREKEIRISQEEQQPLNIKNMDDYFSKYGSSVMNNLEKQLHPVSELNGEIDRITLMKTRPYPQQAAMINGVYEYLRHKSKGSVLFIMGTGSGKTIQSAAAAEMLYVGKWLEEHPGKTLADAYAKDGVINYRHVVMCPGHLVEKWKDSLEKEIPYAKPVIINSFKQLVDLRAAGRERNYGKEFYIISKDFCKLSYQKIPSPRKMGIRPLDVFKCQNCGSIYGSRHEQCSSCGSENIRIVHTRFMRTGMICPNCNRLLFAPNTMFDLDNLSDPEEMTTQPLQNLDFIAETSANETCYYCGEKLWIPYVKNINTEFGSVPKEKPWIRQTFWANKSQKGKKTYWILRGAEEEARMIYGHPLNEIDEDGGYRKYSPAEFIKKYMKGYFDVFIADEVHKSKGGSTAQGNAFHWLMKSSRYVFGLSGSIAGGVASDLFYLLFRMHPARMIDHGYSFHNVLKFSQEYGCVEQDFEFVKDVRMNTFSRGRQLSQIRTLPGISPKVFSEFLLDSAVFLNITDMSANMPLLQEKVILVSPTSEAEKEAHWKYNRLIEDLREYERAEKVNLASIRNQYALSYLDKPYGVPEIVDPRDGMPICRPGEYSFIVENGGLLAKEEKLIEIVRQELSEGRNCAIYAEYTSSEETNILPRLSQILKEHLQLSDNEVIEMRATSPSAAKREQWMHKRAGQGMKVMICNPRLCETGLDFCWVEKGTVYNYPTLIFYQCGYSLFTVWQAAGRSWRLNQREECRTYYLAYAGTVQQAILQVLGEKKSATSAIQGRFSADGLSAMAKGVDTQVRIAQIMNEMDHDSGNRLQEMFDVISDSKEDSEYGSCKKMKLLDEIIKMVEKEPDLLEKHANIFSDFMSFGMFEQSKNDLTALNLNSLMGNIAMFGKQDSGNFKDTPKKKRKKKESGQYYSLFEESAIQLKGEVS